MTSRVSMAAERATALSGFLAAPNLREREDAEKASFETDESLPETPPQLAM